jgi:hypothetical protein
MLTVEQDIAAAPDAGDPIGAKADRLVIVAHRSTMTSGTIIE